MGSLGWPFARADAFPGAGDDPLYQSEHIRDLYLKADPNYGGRFVIFSSDPIDWYIFIRVVPQVYCTRPLGQEAAHDCEQRKLRNHSHLQLGFQ